MKTSAPKDRIRVVTTVLGQGMLILSGVVVCVTFSVNESFIRVWVGPQLFGGTLLTAMILTGMLLRHLDLAFVQALFAMGHERAIAVKSLADGVVTTVSAFLVIHWLGLYGAALAQICGILLVSLPNDIRLFSREFKISAWGAVSPYMPYLWRLIVTCVAGSLLTRYVNPHSYFALAGVTVVVVVTYFALVLPYAWKKPIGGYIQSTLAHLLASVMNPGTPAEASIPVDQASGVRKE
jgi:O-antigen/teichoic acid export membrane protein